MLFRSNLHIPHTYFECIKGNYFDEKHCPISKKKLIEQLSNRHGFVIKKTVDTSSGRDVEIINDNVIDVEKLVDMFGDNYVIQELIDQNESLKRLNSSSLNTFRVISYLCDEDIYICPISLRLGRNGAKKDNIHYGGISVGVNSDGTLKKYAFTEFGEKFSKHPDSGIEFDGYSIEKTYEDFEEIARQLHARIPWLGIISWDFSIDSKGQIVLIEMNTTGQSAWFPQMVNGEPLFGKNTEKILKMIK